MKKTMIICAVLSVLVMRSMTVAAVTFQFDPDLLIQAAPASAGDENVAGETKATQLNARRVHQTWSSTYYETFYNPTAPQTQPDSYNTYMNWRDGLGANEGISGFNIWLLDNPRARSWGETVVWDTAGDAPTGTAAEGWYVKTIANPWGAGWLVEWWTDNPAYYINTLSDIGNFSFTGTCYYDNNANGYDSSDTEVVVGDEARIWFGAVNYTYEDGTQSWSNFYDDLGWGCRTPGSDPWSAGLIGSTGYGSGYEGVLNIVAVPEPATMLLLGLGSLLGLKRKK